MDQNRAAKMGKKKQKKAEQQQQKQQQQQSPTVAEATRIRISQILDGFLASKDEVYTFDANLSNRERAVVHEVCKKMGMTSKSSGRGKQRRVSVYKSKKRVETDKGKENLPSLTFSEGSKLVLQDLFTHYPPDDGEPGEKLDANQSRKSDKTRGKRDDIFCKPKMSKAEIAMKVESLTSRIEKDANLRQIVEERSKLPISSFKDVITSTVDSNQVVLISGETGCGKTTQIRLESKGGKHSSIVFCTNGVLLRLLVSQGVSRLKEASNKPAKDDVSALTHIIVDEIHERDRYSDFMLAIIRDMLPSYPHLRLVKSFYLEDVLSILKSAESNHLDSASLIVPNEDPELTEENKSTLDEAISLAWSNDEFDMLLELVSLEGSPNVYNYQHTLTGLTPLMVLAGKGRVGDVCMLLSLGADCQLKAKDGRTALQLGEQENQPEVAQIIKKHMENALSDSMKQQLLDKYLATVNPELIDLVLIEQLLRKICMDSEDGAILVFLPGWEDINKTRDRLLANPFFRDTSKFVIIPLHSMVPSVQQKKVFKRPPPGCRKIILSTNIAETAITIDDVVYVIDSGRMKEKSYDPYNNVSTLQSSWVSKASAKQRAGRAGRCQAGICYHLYSQLRAASLPDFQVPEIKRIPIEELCLQVKLLDPNCNIEDFLQKTLDPPVSVTIRNAIIVLQDIGALSLDEKVTELGEKLGCLSVHPLMSKMLFFAILMDCLDPALTLACASDYRDPFTLPISPNEKKRATAAKFELASLYGGQSDQLAVIAAFECWKNAKQRGQEAWFCSQYFVSSGVMNMLLGMRKQLQTELIKNGFIPEDVSSCSHNARVPGIIHAVLMAGLYPMVARLRPPHKNGRRFVETAGGAKVRLHPHSLNFKLSFKKTDDCPLMVYDEITRGDGGMHVRNCTVVGPLPLLLLATEIAVAPAPDNEDDDEDDDMSDDDADENESDEDCMEIDDKTSVQHGENVMSSPDKSVTVVVDRWLYFGSTALDIAQIYCLRERLSAAILFKVTHPQKALPPVLEASMYAMASILSYDGFSGISLPAESVESLTSMIQATEIDKCPAARNRGTGQNPSNFLMSLMSPNTRQYFPLRDHKSRIPAHKGSTKGNQLSTQVAQPPLFHGSPVVGSGSVKVYNALFQYGKTPDFGLS
ncbi:RNA helicase [Citrus sinensis]|uniref:RNA helicase n=2 Tax=Citrus sinensis TaxID=2711 RepID=A0ACB8LAU2_CITSI|nr:RNA helicase [Citrus sinensis]